MGVMRGSEAVDQNAVHVEGSEVDKEPRRFVGIGALDVELQELHGQSLAALTTFALARHVDVIKKRQWIAVLTRSSNLCLRACREDTPSDPRPRQSTP